MESVPNLQASGEDIERALMDLGPLLGVTIKEEAPDELADAIGASASNRVSIDGGSGGGGAGSSSVNGMTGGDGPLPSKTEMGPCIPEGGVTGAGPDSLASPGGGQGSGSGSGVRTTWVNLRCVFCSTLLSQTEGTPKLMECLHSTCESCINSKMEEAKASSRDCLGGNTERPLISCSTCRLQCHPSNMIDQQFVVEKISTDQAGTGAAGGEQHCNSCEDTEPANSYCIDCAEFICDNCVQAHQRLKITKDHTIKSRDEAVAELQAAQGSTRNAQDMLCREHPQERLSLFCETCDRLTCRDCQLQHHRDHKYQFSTEMATQSRQTISHLLSEVSYKRVLLGSAMKVIRDRQALIAEKKKALVHEITQTVVKLTNTINTRGKQLVLRLNEVCDAKQRTLNEKKEALEQLSAITDHCIDFVNAALEQGSDTAVLYSKRHVTQHLQRIKSRRADIPNPEIPVRISLALEKLPDLVKVLSTIGGIVVDGKVDGGAGGVCQGNNTAHSQGPYHPPTGNVTTVATAPTPPAGSAVVALQHVAMQQSFVQSRSGGASPSNAIVATGNAPPPYNSVISQLHHQMQVARHPPGGVLTAMGRNSTAPALRHPHVTSTTHPHHMQGMNEMNLRGLLGQTGQFAAAAAAAAAAAQRQQHQQFARHNQQAYQQAYQQVMGAYASGAYGANTGNASRGGARSGPGPRTPSPAPTSASAQMYSPTAAAKWHIPQHATNGVYDGAACSGVMGNQVQGVHNNDFKITLGRQQTIGGTTVVPTQRGHQVTPTVTSTNPKTPSPSLNGGVGAEATVSLDKLCQESVQDLMATIAKLDSNGVQVLPEHAPAASPHVHSSTGDPLNKSLVNASGTETSGVSDPNEDWCAVCMDGGELMCCDKCPKVFHQYCHIPTIDKLPDETETWQCLLCVNFGELGEESANERAAAAAAAVLSPRQQKIVERITLELYCQHDISLPFREPVPLDNEDYHSKITRPMALDTIRMKLQPCSSDRYTNVAQFVADVWLMFHNAYTYNPPDSPIYKDAKKLEEFFECLLTKFLPDYLYWQPPGDEGPSWAVKRARLSNN